MQIKINSSAPGRIKINSAAASGVLINQGVNWYDGAIVAYQPLGAASYADSKINLANPGTYDAVEGVALSWASETGWTFNGTTQYLTIGYSPPLNGNFTMFARFSGVEAETSVCVIGQRSFNDSQTAIFPYNFFYDAATVVNGVYTNVYQHSASLANGVWGFSGPDAYLNGTYMGSMVDAADPATVNPLFIGARNLDGSADSFFEGDVEALVIFDYTLTSTEVADISAAMAAL